AGRRHFRPLALRMRCDRRREQRPSQHDGQPNHGRLPAPEPVNKVFPVANVTTCAFALFVPFLARYASTVTTSPTFIDDRVQPWRINKFGLASSKPQFATLPL